MNNNNMFREKIRVFSVDANIEWFIARKLKGFSLVGLHEHEEKTDKEDEDVLSQ